MSRRFLAAACLAGLAACAPSRFDRAAESFSTSVSGFTTALDGAFAGLRADTDARIMASLAGSRRVTFATSCDNDALVETVSSDGTGRERLVALPGCTLAPAAANGAPVDPQFSPAARDEPEYRRAAAALRRYASALRGMTSAQSSDDLRASVSGVAKAVNGIGASLVVLSPAAPAAALVASAAIEVGGWVYVNSVEANRLRLLRLAVTQAHPSVQAVATVLGEGLDTVRLARVEAKLGELRSLTEAVPREPPQRREAALAVARTRAAEVAEIQRSNPAAVAQAIVDAHLALKVAIEQNAGQSGALAVSLEDLAERVENLRKAIAALNERNS